MNLKLWVTYKYLLKGYIRNVFNCDGLILNDVWTFRNLRLLAVMLFDHSFLFKVSYNVQTVDNHNALPCPYSVQVQMLHVSKVTN